MVAQKEIDLICFHCGEKHEGTYEDSFYIHQCQHCHNISVLSVTTAFDILNDLYIKRKWHPKQSLVRADYDKPELEFE